MVPDWSCPATPSLDIHQVAGRWSRDPDVLSVLLNTEAGLEVLMDPDNVRYRRNGGVAINAIPGAVVVPDIAVDMNPATKSVYCFYSGYRDRSGECVVSMETTN